MTEREKVFDAFRNCITEPKCRDCPWESCEAFVNQKVEIPKDLALAVIRMLVAQEPRVLTLEEAKSTFVIEYRSGNMREVGARLFDLDVDPLNAEYGKIYRVWTSRPTDEQRKPVKWDD